MDTSQYVDAWGGYEGLVLGGIDENAEIDDKGPEIDLFLNSNSFKDGDVVTSNPVMLSTIYDENGVNNTGNGLGRDIVAVLDGDYANPNKLNEFFRFDVDSYKKGDIVYPFENLSEGMHTLTIKAWDLHNNSSEKTIDFYVDNNADIMLFQVINYPNPMVDYTYFSFDHNKFGFNFSTVIRIYDINGNFVTELSSEDDALNTLYWDGTNLNNVPVSSGVYTYTIEVSDRFGNVTLQQQKLIKLTR